MSVTYSGINNCGPYGPNVANGSTPDPTGALVVPQAPSGAISTNVNRSATATQTALSGKGESIAQQGTAVANAVQTFSGQAWAQGNVNRF